jgi:hypothetical protein
VHGRGSADRSWEARWPAVARSTTSQDPRRVAHGGARSAELAHAGAVLTCGGAHAQGAARPWPRLLGGALPHSARDKVELARSGARTAQLGGAHPPARRSSAVTTRPGKYRTIA